MRPVFALQRGCGGGYQRITTPFAACDFKKSQRIMESNVGTQYKLSALLVNCLARLNSTQAARKLGVVPHGGSHSAGWPRLG